MIEYLVVATREELGLVEHEGPAIITGIGALNVMRALDSLPRNTPLLNVGYCGSGAFKRGEKASITACTLWHPGIKYPEPNFVLEPMPGFPATTCYTITDFGGDKTVDGVFEMELAFILGMGFTNVRAVKCVSDNCDFAEYEQTIQKEKQCTKK